MVEFGLVLCYNSVEATKPHRKGIVNKAFCKVGGRAAFQKHQDFTLEVYPFVFGVARCFYFLSYFLEER